MLDVYLSALVTPEEKTRFANLYVENKSMLYRHARRILNDSQLAEDAVHEAFLKLTTHMDCIQGRSDKDARNYLVIIVKNEAKKIRNERSGMVFQEDTFEPFEDLCDVELEVEGNDEKHRIFEMVKRLNPNYGNALILRYYYGMSCKDAAHSLGISVENLKARVHRGKAMVKNMLEREMNHDGQ